MLAIYKLFPVVCGKGSIKLLKIVWRCQHTRFIIPTQESKEESCFCVPLSTHAPCFIFSSYFVWNY